MNKENSVNHYFGSSFYKSLQIFYLLFDALERCKEVTERLNQEISDMHVLAEDSENEEE